MKYLVTGSGGPGFVSLDEAIPLLENIVHPTFDQLAELEAAGKILAGGLPVGERSLVFIIDVASNDEADKLIQSLPMWGTLEWEVVPLQDFSKRSAQEKTFIQHPT